ncbi:Sodium-coupled monocarboxylate transporter 1, partial [Armadillidium nasatum]
LLWLTLIGKFALHCIGIFWALAIYATYAGCDPMALGKIKKKDEIMPYFVMDKLSLIPGLPGLFVAAIIGGILEHLVFVYQLLRGSCCGKTLALKFDIFKNTSQFYATLCYRNCSHWISHNCVKYETFNGIGDYLWQFIKWSSFGTVLDRVFHTKL